MRLSSTHAVYGLNFVHYELVEFFLVGDFDLLNFKENGLGRCREIPSHPLSEIAMPRRYGRS